VDEKRPSTVAARDGCVVSGASLSGLLSGFVTRWERSRNGDGSVNYASEIPTVSAIEWLAGETGIPERTIKNVVNGAYHTTELRIADALVAAVGCPEAFYDGTLEVSPNPLADRKARAACRTCCGGSTG
jgi:hypothetical protein